MPAISKSRFFEAVRTWSARTVAAAVREDAGLVSRRDPSGRTALHLCARQKASRAMKAPDAIATARVLLAAGADLDAIHPIRDGHEIFPATAVWHAVAWGRNRKLAAYLLRRGADPNNCMFAMVYADDLPTARLLRRHGARIDEVFHQETPLIYAMRHRRTRFGEWLVREGADPNFNDGRGFTALHHAVRRRLPDTTLRLLLKRGARVEARSRDRVPVGRLATRAQRRLLGIAES